MPGSNVVAETPRSMSLMPTHTNTVWGMSSCAIGTCRLNAPQPSSSRSAALTNTVARGNASRYTTRGRIVAQRIVEGVAEGVAGADDEQRLRGSRVRRRRAAVAVAPARARRREENAADRDCDGAGDRLHRSPIACRAGSRAAGCAGIGAGYRAQGRSRRPPPRSRPTPAGRARRSRVAGSRGSG